MIESGPAGAATLEQRAIDAVYLRRARQLAKRQTVDAISSTMAVLIAGVGTERYGLELSALAEVFPFRGCTPIPGSTPALLGVMNVRGDIKPVADLGRLLELPSAAEATGGYVVMLRHQEHSIGFRVETVDEVRQIDPARLMSTAAGAVPIAGARFVKALTADTVILIDTVAVLSHLEGRGEARARP